MYQFQKGTAPVSCYLRRHQMKFDPHEASALKRPKQETLIVKTHVPSNQRSGKKMSRSITKVTQRQRNGSQEQADGKGSMFVNR